MKQKIIISGFGGQGIMLIGQILAQSAFEGGFETTVLPTYGVEQRGGTANTTVVIADGAIGSPVAPHPDLLIAMNQASVDRFGPAIRPGGCMIANCGQMERPLGREDITLVDVDAESIAQEAGSPKTANIVILGAVLGYTKLIPLETAQAVTAKKLSKKPEFAAMNAEALNRGYAVGAAMAGR